MLQNHVWLGCGLFAVFGLFLGKGCCFLAEGLIKKAWAEDDVYKLSQKAETPMVLPYGLAQFWGASFLCVLFWNFQWSWQFLKLAVLGFLLLLVSIVDYNCFIIPDQVLLLGGLFYVWISAASGQPLFELLWQGFLSGCAVALPLLAVVCLADYFMGQETMGGGDLKLFFLLGIYLGPVKTLLALFLACCIGLCWQLWQNRLRTATPFPFGPSIAMAAALSALWGDQILAWYRALFLMV